MKTASLNRLCIAFLIPALGACVYHDLSESFSCETSSLEGTLVSSVDASSCKAIDGSMILSASGGQEPYSFSLNGGEFQTHSAFANLGAGSYLVTLKDDHNCERSLQVDIGAANSTLDATFTTSTDSQCLTDNGSITVTASGGKGPYQYGWASGAFGTNNVLANLKFGQYTVIVKDANDCQKIISVQVPRGNTGISYASTIKPILDTNCNVSSCHGAGTGSRDWTVFSNIKSHAANIKSRTGNRSMPIGDKKLTQAEIDVIACWVDDGANNN
jgi:hypothetical protein